MARLLFRPPRRPAASALRQGSPTLHHHLPSSPHHASAPSIFSRQSFLILLTGVTIGYLVLPILVVQRIGFDDDLSIPRHRTDRGRGGSLLPTIGGGGGGGKIMDDSAEATTARERIVSPATGEGRVRGGSSASASSSAVAGSTDDRPDDGDPRSKPFDVPLVVPVRPESRKIAGSSPRLRVESDLSPAEKRLMEERLLLSTQSIPTSTTPYVMKTPKLPDGRRKKVLVTGGAGFVGSHLVDRLMREGHEVIVMDNFFTGQKKNIEHWLHHPNFSLVVHDVTEHIMLEVDQIYHLACPANPPHYQYNPVKTIKTSTMGTLNMLGLAKRVHARMLLTSTSEIYGDPQVHPQPESYWGNVNTIGPRSCYDEGKRVAETMMYSYRNQNDVEVRVARIFNTFGPRMHPNDGRVVSNFVIQALQNKDLTIYGEGEQTRSFQYVTDLVDGLHALMNGPYDRPVNLGNPDEYSVRKFAEYIRELTESRSEIKHLPKSEDDPSQRRPDISTAKREIEWEPKVLVRDGLKETIKYFQRVLDEAGEIVPTGPGAAKPHQQA